MGMPVAELLARISSEELTEWMAYEQLTGPIGPERGDLLHGILAATVANSAGGKRKAKASDFIPQWGGRVRQHWTEMLAAVRAMNARMGGADLTKDKEGGGGDGSA